MPASHFLADGRERLLESPELQAELAAALNAIFARHAPALAAASPFGRMLLGLRIKREIRLEIERHAPSSALYLVSGQSGHSATK